MFCRNFLQVVCLLGLAQPSFSQPQKAAGDCTIKARSDAVVILVCPAFSKAEVWRRAGEAACETKQVCNAWVWDDSAKAPDKAPKIDSQLSKINSVEAVAIWVNDSKSLMTLKKAGSSK